MSDEMNEISSTPAEADDVSPATEEPSGTEMAGGEEESVPTEEAVEGATAEEAASDETGETAAPEETASGEAPPSPDQEPPAPTPEAEGTEQEVTEQDKLMAFLSYVIGFLVPGIILLSVDMRERRYQRIHATQSLALWSATIVFYAALAVADYILMQLPCIGWLLACVSLPVYLLPPILIFYYALLASQGREFEIPFLSDALRQQGWL